MRSITILLVGALAAPAPALIPVAASAQARGPADSCSREISYAVQDRYPQARGVRITSTHVSDGRGEARVTGKGEFDDRNGGESKFTYGCTYNYRNGRTSDLDVSDVHHGGKDNNGAAIAGLVLGAIVIGAIAASAKDKDKDRDDDWNHHEVWSPADGVRCVARERSCYKNGRYSEKWTSRIFYR